MRSPTFVPGSPELPPVTVHETLPGRVLIGAGARHRVAEEVDRLVPGRVLLVATPSASAPADEPPGSDRAWRSASTGPPRTPR